MQEKRRVAILSNVNMNFVLRMLKREFLVYETEGYGNELAILFNKDSSYYDFRSEITFFVMDLLELVGHVTLSADVAYAKMDQWIAQVESLLETNKIYYITDAYLWGPDLAGLVGTAEKIKVESYWGNLLEELCKKHGNVRILPYRKLVEELGESNSFSLKTWYLGKILHSSQLQKMLGDEIKYRIELEYRVPKKVLVLDLDNTLWGGLAGEHEHTPVQLSDDHEGLAYKNQQRVIRYMQQKGVILAIASKNNEEDALGIIRNHPHMILQEKDFACKRINWNQKHENILEMAKELNLGTDSFVFWDDNPQERALVRQMLPEVMVPDFPEECELLAGEMIRIYKTYFEKPVLTAEDVEKTKQYQENAKRQELERAVGSFSDYLKQLNIVIERVEAQENINRLHQLVNKTNQFNLTTKRYEVAQVQEMISAGDKKIYLYKVSDCFGDYGIVAAVIVDLKEKEAEIEEFAMSCRIMGKNIEYAIVEYVEKELLKSGFQYLVGKYFPTAKNKPVEKLYDKLGYEVVDKTEAGDVSYKIALEKCPKREYYAEVL